MTNTAVNTEEPDYPVGSFKSVFTGSELFLADHIIQGKSVFPGMAYFELVRAAVDQLVSIGDECILVLRDSVFVNALVVEKPTEVDVQVYPGQPGEFGVEVVTEQGVHFQSKVCVESRTADSLNGHAQERMDLSALRRCCPETGPDNTEFYHSFAERAVELGPSHRGIQSVQLGDRQALVTVDLPGSSARGMVMDPGMLDSIIQGGVVLADNPMAQVVPFAVRETRIFGSLCDRMFVEILRTDKGTDYRVSDPDGQIRVTITDFLAREIDLHAGTDEVSFYSPVWTQEAYAPIKHDETIMTRKVEGAISYPDLVKDLFTSAQQLQQQTGAAAEIEVHIPPHRTEWKGVVAALKTLALEMPGTTGRLISGSNQLHLDFKRADTSYQEGAGWSDNKTVLITGGAGGIARQIVDDMISTAQGCRILLVGRSREYSGLAALNSRAHERNNEVVYAQCDVANRAQVDALFKVYPDINAVIHGAGTSADNLIEQKTTEEIAEVIAPKVQGLINLDEASAECNLDYFIVLSSVAGAIGNAGQFDYAAANGFMDAYMERRVELVDQRSRHGKSLSINWPFWEDGGMDLDVSIVRNLANTYRIKPLPSSVGVNIIKQLVTSDLHQVLVLYGEKNGVDKLLAKSATEEPAPVQSSRPESSGEVPEAVLAMVRQQTGKHLGLKETQLDDDSDWSVFGFDSILLSSFVNRLNTELNIDLMPTVFFEAPNIRLFGAYLEENYPGLCSSVSNRTANDSQESATGEPAASAGTDSAAQAAVSYGEKFRRAYKAKSSYRDKDIAVVGMSVRVAGARTLDQFWDLLISGKDMISEIPRERWDWRDYPGVSKYGSFIEGIEEFDPLFFGISPAEATYMAPEQRLLMQYAWECLEHAGCCGEDIKGSDTALFVGCGPSSYSYFLDKLPVEAYSATGFVPSVGPNRISYMLDWHGPSNPVETACSSALVALHRGVEAIRGGHCGQALVGGVSLLLSPSGYVSFSKSGMLAEDGRCKTFSAQANGYVRGEGIGMLMLKPLAAALEDGNTVHAVIKGSAENHGGRTNSLTAPNPNSQAAVITKALNDADMPLNRVGYIECHGTGTALGDPVEINGLKMVAKNQPDQQFEQQCHLGSIKSNIGHLEYGAGAVGLIKTILQLKHRKIARTLHCDEINPYITLEKTHFRIAQEAVDWVSPPGVTRVAGVSSFGFGGVNAHVVLEEYTTDADLPEQSSDGQDQVLVLSARDEQSLIRYAQVFAESIPDMLDRSLSIRDAAFTLQTGRQAMTERVAFVASSLEEWQEQLQAYLDSAETVTSSGYYTGTVRANDPDSLAITDTSAGRDYVSALVKEKNSRKLAELWCRGTPIDWTQLHA